MDEVLRIEATLEGVPYGARLLVDKKVKEGVPEAKVAAEAQNAADEARDRAALTLKRMRERLLTHPLGE